jgi:hypothetical protein
MLGLSHRENGGEMSNVGSTVINVASCNTAGRILRLRCPDASDTELARDCSPGICSHKSD